MTKRELQQANALLRNLEQALIIEIEKAFENGLSSDSADLKLAQVHDLKRALNKAAAGRTNNFINQTQKVIERDWNRGGSEVEKILAELGVEPVVHGLFDTRRLTFILTDYDMITKNVVTGSISQALVDYKDILSDVMIKYNSQHFTRYEAIADAMYQFNKNGVHFIGAGGRNYNTASYVQNVLRTSATKARLGGQGAKRDAYGEYLCIAPSRFGACPKCSPWLGRVLIDDVYASGTKEQYRGKYTLLSEAMQKGFFHNNCMDTLSPYVEGKSEKPKPLTPEEMQANEDYFNLTQRQRYNERQIRKYKQLARGTKSMYNDRYKTLVKKWQKTQRAFITENEGNLVREYEREKIY